VPLFDPLRRASRIDDAGATPHIVCPEGVPAMRVVHQTM
jgi:hypothetical protein